MVYGVKRHFQQYFHFIGGENRSTRRKPQTCRKALANLSHNVVSSTPYNELGCKSNYHMIQTTLYQLSILLDNNDNFLVMNLIIPRDHSLNDKHLLKVVKNLMWMEWENYTWLSTFWYHCFLNTFFYWNLSKIFLHF